MKAGESETHRLRPTLCKLVLDPHENGDPIPLRPNYLPVDGTPASGGHTVVQDSLDQAVAGVTKTWKSE